MTSTSAEREHDLAQHAPAPARDTERPSAGGPWRAVEHGGTPRGSRHAGYGWLVLQFALKDFKMRYTHSWLGYGWSVLNPLAFFMIYYVVFTVFVQMRIANYPVFLLLGVVLWNFFSEGTANGVSALLARADLVTKTAVPRQVVVYAALLSAALTFVLNLLIFVVMLLVLGPPLHAPAACFPLLLADLAFLILGIALLLAPLHVRFRDIGYLWSICLQVGFWLTPIIYLDMMIPDRWRWIVWINPIGRIIGDSRRALVYGLWPGGRGLLITTAYSIGIYIAGAIAFRHLQGRVAEYL